MAAAARSVSRLSSVAAASRFAPGARTFSLRPRLRLPNAAAAPRFLRSPAEMSFCVESLMPMHNATAAALMRSMLSVPGKGCGWLIEGNDDK